MSRAITHWRGNRDWSRTCAYCFHLNSKRSPFIGGRRKYCQLCGRTWKAIGRPPEGTLGVDIGIEFVGPKRDLCTIRWIAFRRKIKRWFR